MILFTTSPDDPDYTTVRFQYDEVALAIIKSVPVHRWDPSHKRWTVETSSVQLLAKRFADKGYSVAIDDELWPRLRTWPPSVHLSAPCSRPCPLISVAPFTWRYRRSSTPTPGAIPS